MAQFRTPKTSPYYEAAQQELTAIKNSLQIAQFTLSRLQSNNKLN